MASARGSGDCGAQHLIPGRRALGLNTETSASNMRMIRQFVGAEGLNPDLLHVREGALGRSAIPEKRGAIAMTGQLADLANMFIRSNGFYAFESATTMSLERRTCPKGGRVVRAGTMALSAPTSLTATITRTLGNVGAGRFLPDGTGVGG
jgi:hypothetical protein